MIASPRKWSQGVENARRPAFPPDQHLTKGENIGRTTSRAGSSFATSILITSAFRGQRPRSSWHIGLASCLVSKSFCRL
jgi:hypothetical protein